MELLHEYLLVTFYYISIRTKFDLIRNAISSSNIIKRDFT